MTFSKKSEKRVIIDSNVFIAGYNDRDSTHEMAVSLLKKFTSSRKIVNFFILNEIATVLLLKRKEVTLSSGIVESILSGEAENFSVSPITKKLMNKTLTIFATQRGKSLSFTDCSLIAQAELEKIDTILSFDKDLKKAFKHKFTFLG